MKYRFPKYKGNEYSTFESHERRYDAIRSLLGTKALGAELGVYKGGFAEFLLPHCKLLYLVDPWDWDVQEQAQSFIRKVYEDDRRIFIRNERADDFLESCGHRFDFLYLDTTHEYGDTIRELSLCYSRLKPDRYIIGDDWAWEGVRLAVTHFCKGKGLDFMPLRADQWAIHKARDSNT